jgi:hypothetical protein
MSLLSYGLIVFGVMLGGSVWLLIFGLLALAQQGDKHLDQLEFILSQRQTGLPQPVKEGQPSDSYIPAHPHLRLVDAPPTRILTRP